MQKSKERVFAMNFTVIAISGFVSGFIVALIDNFYGYCVRHNLDINRESFRKWLNHE